MMSGQRYLLAADCPVCGCKDAKDEWVGARMWSTEWRHDFPCCSDKCGEELAKQIKGWSPQKIAGLWRRMESQCEWRLR